MAQTRRTLIAMSVFLLTSAGVLAAPASAQELKEGQDRLSEAGIFQR